MENKVKGTKRDDRNIHRDCRDYRNNNQGEPFATDSTSYGYNYNMVFYFVNLYFEICTHCPC